MSSEITRCVLKYGAPRDQEAVGEHGRFPPMRHYDPTTIARCLNNAVITQDLQAVRTLSDYIAKGPFAGDYPDRLAAIKEMLPIASGQIKVDLEKAERTLNEKIWVKAEDNNNCTPGCICWPWV